MAERVGAEHHERSLTAGRPARLPAADGAAPGRADRRPRLRSRLLRLEARARQRRRSSRRSAKAPTSCSGATRRGRRSRSLAAVRTTCRCRASLKRAGVGARAAGSARDDGARSSFSAAAAAGQPIFWSGAEAFTQAQKERLLSPRLRRDARRPHVVGGDRADARALARRGRWEPSHLNWMSYVDLNLRLPELLLMRVDKMSMGVSLEGRVPFLDHKFVELAMSIPESVEDARRHAEAHPQEGRARRDPGRVDRPAEAGLRRPGPRVVLRPARRRGAPRARAFCEQTDFLDRDEVMRYVDTKQGPEVWYLLNFALWWKEFVAV